MNSTCQNGTPYARAGITELTSGKVNIEISALLKDTLLLIKKWQKDTDNDALWWYRERAFVGFLSACIAARGGKFIQEYSFRKKGPGNIGRADLRLKTGAGSVYNLEAKHTFYTPRQKKREIEALLSEASGQLEKFDDGESKVAIVIITFRSVNEKSGWKTDKIIAAIKQEFEKLNSHHYQGFWGGYIQASLNEGKARMYYSGGEDDAWYPGLCVIAAFGKNKGNCSPHHGKADPSRGTSKEEASQDDK